MGYVEGQTVSIDYHWITDRYSSLPATAVVEVEEARAIRRELDLRVDDLNHAPAGTYSAIRVSRRD